MVDLSAPEPKAHVHYCDHALSVVLYQVCVLRADRKKQDDRLGLWLAKTFTTSLKPLNGIQRNRQGAWSQSPLPSLCFSFWSEKQHVCPGILLAETFTTSPLKPLNGINETWQEANSQGIQVHLMWPFGHLVIFRFDISYRYFLNEKASLCKIFYNKDREENYRHQSDIFLSLLSFFSVLTILSSTHSVVVKSLTCGARGPGFNFNFAATIVEIGYLLLPSRDMAEIPRILIVKFTLDINMYYTYGRFKCTWAEGSHALLWSCVVCRPLQSLCFAGRS